MCSRTASAAILIVLSTSLLTLTSNTHIVKSTGDDWWNAHWTYRRQISINENSGYQIGEFPLEVAFQHDGKSQSDGDDIRVIIDGVEIPSYVTSIDSAYAEVVFEMSLAASETKSVYIYYGNPLASAPSYPLVPLTISEGQTGYAVIDNLVYVGWRHTKWGWDGDNNLVVLWTDYRVDSDGNGNPSDDNDLIRDVSYRTGGIGRHRLDYGNAVVRSLGLGDYQSHVQTAVYIELEFADVTLRVYRNNPFVETVNADYLFMFGPSYDYANCGIGSEQNIIDGSDVNQITPSPPWHYPWNEMHISPLDPQWMAWRDSVSGEVFCSVGLNVGTGYNYVFAAKEGSDWDRCIFYDFEDPYVPLEAYDQPIGCRIFWYGDKTNGYSEIHKLSEILHNQPSASVGTEETAELEAMIDVDPDTLNLRSKGKWITAYIQLPEGYNTEDIDATTILLNDTISPVLDPKYDFVTNSSEYLVDHNNDGILERMIKFDRAAVQSFIYDLGIRNDDVALAIAGKLFDDTEFEGTDTITVITNAPFKR